MELEYVLSVFGLVMIARAIFGSDISTCQRLLLALLGYLVLLGALRAAVNR